MRAAITAALAALVGGCVGGPDPLLEERWALVWEDEFRGDAGASPDPTKWTFDIGGDGWGNAQLEFNTDRPENAALDGDGFLRINARREAYEGNTWTSARLKTQGLFATTYGRIEARILLPKGKGFWPAFWTLGTDIDEVSWPRCGEIDIMEARGDRPTEILGTIHGPGYSGGASFSGDIALPADADIATFHTYRIDWDPQHIAWYVDDVLYHTAHPGHVRGPWVFDKDFFLIMNLAVGGTFLPNPDETTPDVGLMVVDWVRVYERRLPLEAPLP
jgi:beta-glucanase (GH16 family)